MTPQRDDLVDIVGTGGDGARTFNISTAAALVAAAAGAAVAKHGNRAASSAVRIGRRARGARLRPRAAARADRALDRRARLRLHVRAAPTTRRCGIAAPVRQELGIAHRLQRARAAHEPGRRARRGLRRLLRRARARRIAEALAELGARRAFVVHGDGGLDELSPFGPNLVFEVVDGDVREWELDPRDLGIEPRDPAAAARRLGRGERRARSARSSRASTGARRDAVLLNAAGAIVAAGLADDLVEGLALGAETIDSGAAASRLDALVAFSPRRRG